VSWLLAGTAVASGLVAVLTIHTLINARLLRRPPEPVTVQDSVTLQESFTVRDSLTVQENITVPKPAATAEGAATAKSAAIAESAVVPESAAVADGAAVVESVAVLLPLRDEADRVSACLHALLQQRGVPGLRLVVLDDGSTDGTAEVVRGIDPRIELHPGRPLPDGWLGKPHACHQLAETVPDATVLVFVDADVVLEPHAVAASVSLLRSTGVDLLSPYPRIVALGVGERIVQPLLQWSWLTFVPLRALERSARPSLSAAGGQLLVADHAGYRRAGGHAGVRGEILEDIALARAVKRAGGRVALADGSGIATCRMYTSWRELVDGYAKSLWASFGPPAGAAA